MPEGVELKAVTADAVWALVLDDFGVLYIGSRFVVNLGEEIVTGRRPKYPTRWNQFEEEGVDRRPPTGSQEIAILFM